MRRHACCCIDEVLQWLMLAWLLDCLAAGTRRGDNHILPESLCRGDLLVSMLEESCVCV